MRASIITIGDEILIGQIVDTNSAWLGKELNLLGVDVQTIVTVSDKERAISDAISSALKNTTLIILTGGLGPTKDDITKKTLANYFNSELYFHQQTYDRIAGYFNKRGIPITSAIKDQCNMPTDAIILDNDLGTAPGMLFKSEGKLILSVPGVPYEMKWIFSNSFLPFLKEHLNDSFIYHKTIKTIGRGESQIAEEIEDITMTLPSEISLAFLPSIGQVKLRLTSKSKSNSADTVNAYANKISQRLSAIVFGFDDDTIESSLAKLFIEKKLTLATAESCTGGYLAHRLTSIPGSSSFYQGSVIAYSYKLKEQLLGVSKKTLLEKGAVSEETVKEMLNGLLERLSVDVGVSISGIAGPGGGTPDKPVGTIWMAWGSKGRIQTKKLELKKDRDLNIKYTSVAAMNALRYFIDQNV